MTQIKYFAVNEEIETFQIISNTNKYWELTQEEIMQLKAIRNRKKDNVAIERKSLIFSIISVTSYLL